ncbi:hypothetical protein MCOR14_010504 [Pyricularia oryzae]|nr:hypothetical protein MCOR12_011187 [Pyricularia oryzae]KAI6619021.1 hypothetical protein MCOR14_010504 [Pyricularia oryzae]
MISSRGAKSLSPGSWMGGQRYWTRNEDHGKDGEGSRAFAKKSCAQTERNQLGDGGSNGASTSHEGTSGSPDSVHRGCASILVQYGLC